jgi:hypothetical protein
MYVTYVVADAITDRTKLDLVFTSSISPTSGDWLWNPVNSHPNRSQQQVACGYEICYGDRIDAVILVG